LVELLVAATILSIGILSLAMLQAMSLKASRGSANAVAAALLAGQIMDRAELEGRVSRLNATDSNRANPSLGDIKGFDFRYITIKSGEKLEEAFNAMGGPVAPVGPNDPEGQTPSDGVPFFRATTRRAAAAGAPDAPGAPGAVGQMSDISVRVEFSDSAGRDGRQARRTISLTRRIAHG
jgi:Tfp pilus assembly protein PilE